MPGAPQNKELNHYDTLAGIALVATAARAPHRNRIVISLISTGYSLPTGVLVIPFFANPSDGE